MLNFDTRAATLAVSAATMSTITDQYDVFSRPDFGGEVILDTCGMAPDESPVADLAKLAGEDAEALADTYLILYHDEDLD